MSKIVSFLVALALAYNLSTGVVYGDTITNEIVSTTEASTEINLQSLLEDIDNVDIDSLDEETRQALIDKLVSDYFSEASIELSEVDSGITPDSFFYFFDKLIEDIRVSLTSSEAEKARLLAEIALERLAEFNGLESEERAEYMEEIISDYIDAIGQATEAVEQAQAEDPEAEVTDIVNVIDEATQVGDDIINSGELPDEVVEEVSDQLEKVQEVVIKVKSVAGIDTEIVTKLREQGLGYGEIKLISQIASMSEKTVDEVMTLYSENKGIGKTMKAIGISPSQLNGKANKAKVEVSKEESKEIEEENDEAVQENEQTTEVSNYIEEADDDSDEVEDEEIEVKQQEVKKNVVKQAEETRKAAEKQAEAEKKAAEKQAEAEKRAAEKQAEAAKKSAEKQDEVSKKAEQAKENKNRNKLNNG